MALLHLTADWARARGRRLLALTVDHNLNPQSADWTRFAGEAARAAGADWRGLSWDEAAPGPGLPARSRAARHGLIAEAARAAGARVVLLAHTLDDVAEADWMRAKGSTIGRVREWSPSPVWPQGCGLMLLRPLLDERRETLRGYLRVRGQGWIEDPANADERFGRSRARAALCAEALPLEGGGLGGGVVAALSDQAGETQTVPPPAPDLGGLRVHPHPRPFPRRGGREFEGFCHLVWAGVLDIPRDASASTLAAALLCAGGGAVPPRGERLERLRARLTAGEDFAAGLAGARVEAAGPSVRLMREPGEMKRRPPEPVTLAPGVAAVWDGRFEVTAREDRWRVEMAAGRLARLSEADRRVVAGLPAGARGGLPVLLRDGGDGPILAWRGAEVRALGARRLRLALGETTQEADLFHPMHGETPPTDLFS